MTDAATLDNQTTTPEIVAALGEQVSNLHGTVSFERKVNLGNYESASAYMSVQFDIPLGLDPSNLGALLITRARDAYFAAKSVVYAELGIDVTIEESGELVEVVRRVIPEATVEQAAAPAVQGTVSDQPPHDKAALKEWALARFTTHPGEFFDNRGKKASGEYKSTSPDLKHRATGRGIWLS